MRPPNSKTAFTLVELLVVIAIIGTLMGLLLPAVQSAREAGRRNTCTNNVNQLAKAVLNYDGQKQTIPGWRNAPRAAGGIFYPSWPVMLLPYLERTDVYRLWESGTNTGAYVNIFICPTAPTSDQVTAWLSYAGNAGTGTTNKADGVMLDATVARTNLDLISGGDGAANTLLFSEKCGSVVTQGVWNASVPAISGTQSLVFTSNGSTSSPTVFGIANPINNSIATGRIVNVLSGTQSTPSTSDFGYFSQPTANHPGGAVAAFADGHTVFLKDSVRSFVYAQLVTSDSGRNTPTAARNSSWIYDTSGTTGWLQYNATPTVPYVLQDGDY